MIWAVFYCVRASQSHFGLFQNCFEPIRGCFRLSRCHFALFTAVLSCFGTDSEAVPNCYRPFWGSFRQFQGSLGLFQVFLCYVGAIVGCFGAILESFGSCFRSFQGCFEASRDILRFFWAVLHFFMRFQATQKQFLGYFQAILGLPWANLRLLGPFRAILVVSRPLHAILESYRALSRLF
jgi:hypothetical protein